MSFKSRSFIINVSPQNTKHIIYKNQHIPVDYYLLKRNSGYFRTNDQKYCLCENIPLLEEENNIEFPLSAIQEFIKCCQSQPIEINPSNLFYLNYLAKKYEVKNLENETFDIISSNKEQLALDSLIFILNVNKNKDLAFVETGKEEEIISDNFQYFIKDDKIFQIPIPTLFRIVQRFYLKNKNNNEGENKFDEEFTSFLFKLLDKHHEKASVFFQFFDINKNKIGDLMKLHDTYSKSFDSNFLNTSLFDTTIE